MFWNKNKKNEIKSSVVSNFDQNMQQNIPSDFDLGIPNNTNDMQIPQPDFTIPTPEEFGLNQENFISDNMPGQENIKTKDSDKKALSNVTQSVNPQEQAKKDTKLITGKPILEMPLISNTINSLADEKSKNSQNKFSNDSKNNNPSIESNIEIVKKEGKQGMQKETVYNQNMHLSHLKKDKLIQEMIDEIKKDLLNDKKELLEISDRIKSLNKEYNYNKSNSKSSRKKPIIKKKKANTSKIIRNKKKR